MTDQVKTPKEGEPTPVEPEVDETPEAPEDDGSTQPQGDPA